MPQYYRVLYNFEAEEDVELSVNAGDYVVAMSDTEPDEWIQITAVADGRKGCVPTGFVEKVDFSEVQMSQQAAIQAKTDEIQLPPVDNSMSDLSSRDTSLLQNLGEPAVAPPPTAVKEVVDVFTSEHHVELPERRTTSPKATFTALTPEISGQSPIPNTHSQPGVLIESFMKNELYFRSLVKQRQETFQKLDNCINETASEIALCKSKNSNLAKKIRELDSMIEEDRAKWRSRVEEEKRLLMSQTNNNLGMINSLPTF
eukprot:TRINITY_DN3500_c2_g1_i1.p1 TRINITY_DN3500_c2_g1~~TRINITY_DN3500_c2_g1_i1.p1  ORF type:complete len:270 (+),score=68.88 TRINITY_DN3500_c2_g1_i1:39-812(+)